jgi:acetyl-CoA C-acetyltransferase
MAESIRDKVAVVGVGACQFGENWDQSREDMIVDAAYEAYADAGIDDPQRRIEAVFAGAVYPREGTAEIAESLKLFGKPISLVSDYCQTGTDAFRFECSRSRAALRHGARGRLRQAEGPRVSGRRSRSTRVRGLPATTARLVLAVRRALFRDVRRRREDLAKIAVKNHHNGTLAPKSMLKREITVKDVLEARIISWPFGLYDCAAQSGRRGRVRAHAAPSLAKKLPRRSGYVKAVSIAVAEHPQRDPNFDFLGWKPTIYPRRTLRAGRDHRAVSASST